MTGARLRPYRAIVGARFRMMLQYRVSAIAGVFTQIMFGLVYVMVFEAFYRSSTPAVQPMTFAQIAAYVWLGQALLAMLPWNADPEIRAMIRSGAVAYELCRPVDLYAMWFARALAWRTAPTVLRAIPMTIFAMVLLPVLGMPEWRLAPPGAAHGLAFVVSLACAVLLACAMSTLLHVAMLRTISSDGIVMIAGTAVAFFCGLTIPLPLMPDWAQDILPWLPFAGLADQPFRIYSGSIELVSVPLVIARQLAWTLALIVFGRWLLSRTVRRIVVQGG